jgi:hypothetical protein
MNIQRIQSNEVGKALTLARKNHWWFRVIGTGAMISSPKYQDGWWLVPINEDKTIIPKNALERVEKLKQDGIRIQGVIVAHEAPKLLCAPAKEPFKIDTEAISKTAGEVAAGLARVIATIFGILFYLVTFAVLVDPALIVVLEDGTYVEVMTWYEA